MDTKHLVTIAFTLLAVIAYEMFSQKSLAQTFGL